MEDNRRGTTIRRIDEKAEKGRRRRTRRARANTWKRRKMSSRSME